MKVIKTISLFSISFISILLLLEIFLRFAGILTPIVKIDPVKGERYFTNKTCSSLFTGEGFGLGRTNSYGWFGKEYIRDSENLSIGIIGNSYVASRQVFTRDNFMSLCENYVNESQESLKVSVYNFGKESMSLGELLYVKEEIETSFKLDYIVILLNEENLFGRTRYVPFYEFTNDSLTLNTSFKEVPLVKISDKIGYLSQSSLMFLAYRVKNKLPLTPKILFDKFYLNKKNTDFKTEIREVSRTDNLIIRRLDNDSKVVFLLDFDSELNEIIKNLIVQSPIIDLSTPFSKLVQEQGIDPRYWKISNEFGHWNNAAHSVIGKELGSKLIQIINEDKNMLLNTNYKKLVYDE